MSIVNSNRPKLGERLSIVVCSQIKSRWASFNRAISDVNDTSNNQYDVHTGVVVELPWLLANQFGLSTNDRRFPVRVITCDDICKINGVNVKFEIDSGDRQVVVNSNTSSDQYVVKIKCGKPVSCTCKGFGFRGKCKHLQQAQ